MTARNRAATMTAVALLGGCGSVSELEPAPENSPPPVAYGTEQSPSAEALLDKATQAQPDRSDELLRQSRRRESDEFDLPPEG